MLTRLCIPIVFFVIVVGTASAQELDSELEWTPLNNGAPMDYVTALAGSEHRLYAATLGGIFSPRTVGVRGSSLHSIMRISSSPHSQPMEIPFMQERGTTAYSDQMMPG